MTQTATPTASTTVTNSATNQAAIAQAAAGEQAYNGPVFDADSTYYQNLGLLKVAETAVRKNGDIVAIHASEERDMVILSGTDSVRYWKNHQGHFHTELADVPSNATLSQILLGSTLEDPAWADVWASLRIQLSAINKQWDAWFHTVLVDASEKLVQDIATATEESETGAIDLRPLCRLWSVRCVCPALFGPIMPDEEMAQGLMDIEDFYFAMSTKEADEIAVPQQLEEYKVAREFVDHAVKLGMDAAKDGDDTVIAWLMKGMPEHISETDAIDCLRPMLGRMLLEKLNIDGLGLLWPLAHTAQDAGLIADLRAEAQELDWAQAADNETPLTYSVVQEGQRLYPELPFIYRINSKDVDLEGIHVPAKSTILFAPWLVHRDDRFWEKAKSFDGRRFVGQSYDSSHYFPFGVGPRTKARAKFILHQFNLAMRAVCKHYDFAIAPENRPGNMRPLLRSTLAPRGEVLVTFTPVSSDHVQD